MSNNDDVLLETELLSRVADVLLALSNVGFGDYSTRIDTSNMGDGPLTELVVGINDMIGALEEEHRRSQAYQAEVESKLAMVEEQRATIRQLSTPVLEVWEGVLCLPVVGVIDTIRSAEMTGELLEAITTKETRCAIIDITGIEVMDTSTAEHFIRMAKSARLLGAECVITGLNPTIAQTIVHMGIDLTDIITYRSLRDALKWHVRRRDRRNRAGRRAEDGARAFGPSASEGAAQA